MTWDSAILPLRCLLGIASEPKGLHHANRFDLFFPELRLGLISSTLRRSFNGETCCRTSVWLAALSAANSERISARKASIRSVVASCLAWIALRSGATRSWITCRKPVTMSAIPLFYLNCAFLGQSPRRQLRYIEQLRRSRSGSGERVPKHRIAERAGRADGRCAGGNKLSSAVVA